MIRHRIPLKAVYRVEADELEAEFVHSHRALVTVAIGEAIGMRLHDSTRAWLQAPDQIPDWFDALLCAQGELQVSSERMRYFDDPRIDNVSFHLKRVRQRIPHVRKLLKAAQKEQLEASPDAVVSRDAVHLATRWFGKCFPDEMHAHRKKIMAAKGLPPDPPLYLNTPGGNWADAVEQAHEGGLLTAPITPQVQRLMNMTDAEFRYVVAEDCKDQDERNTPLRHPLLLSDWYDTLETLAEELLPDAHAATTEALGSLGDDFYDLDHASALSLLNKRRFFAALIQRKVEWRTLKYRLMFDLRTRQREHAQPWVDATDEAHRILISEHPAEYDRVRRIVRQELQGGQTGRELLPGISTNDRGRVRALILSEIKGTSTTGASN